MLKHSKILLVLSLSGILLISGCDFTTPNSDVNSVTSSENTDGTSGGSENTDVTVESTTEESEPENDGDFTITTSDGSYTSSDGVYTITTAGTYTLSGVLEEGMIYVNAGDDDEVDLELNGVSLYSSSNSLIWVENADEVHIKAIADTSNLIKDTRSNKTTDSDDQGEGAIYSKCDTHLTGKGTLVVSGTYNNGVHITKDLKIKNQTLQVTAYNNALKGNDSITVESGTLKLYSIDGDGMKTEDSDISSKGNQRGIITISGGTIYIDAANDGIDASYNVVVEQADSSVSTTLQILTGKYSSY